MDFRNKKVLVTGGAIRVGREICKGFAHAGASVVIHCNTHIEEGKRLLEELGGPGKGHALFSMDLAHPAELEKEENIRMLGEMFSSVDILVNNASCYIRTPVQQETLPEMERQLNINFLSPSLLMKLFAEKAKEGSVIVNMLDQGIAKTDKNTFSYALSKKAFAEAAKSAALSYAPRIRVNSVAPGPMIPPPDLPLSKMEKSIQSIPLQKAIAVEDVVSACLFVAGNASMTGAIVYVDGGLSLT